MGQRHQVFTRIPNPAFNCENISAKEKAELRKEFGTKKTTILAFHNQWLYGRSALQNCLNLLKFSAQFTKKDKTSKDGGAYDSPISPLAQRYNFDREKIISSIEFIMNFRPNNTDWLLAGIGNTVYIGKEDEDIREDFTGGDNNDGITIIDTIENKYCFMNICKTDKKYKFGIYSLPSLTPVTARQYVSAYYGETIETTNPFYFGDHDWNKITISKEEQQKIVNDNIETNDKACQGFEKFELLTLKEIKEMFPNMKWKRKTKKGKKIEEFYLTASY